MEKWEPRNPNFTKVECPHKEFSLDEQAGLLRQLKQMNPDLVHFGMVQQPVFYKGKVVTTMHDLTGIRFRNPTKNPVVFTIKQQIYKWVNKRVARKSDAIITPTEFVRQDAASYTHISPDKITVTYESADEMPPGAEPVSGLEDAQFIMYLGRPQPHKNLARLISAYAQLKQKYPDIKLVLAGRKDAMYELHEQRIIKENIPDVVFTDYISDQQLRWLYEHCAVYVFAALSEGFGLPALEAMLHGAPVASSNATCLPEVYGDAAHYFDPTSVDDMARAIEDILVDENLRKDLITKGAVQAKKYSWQHMAEQTLAIYNKVLND
jgi:glycosyltransferase involved in cell wall biosynthesis